MKSGFQISLECRKAPMKNVTPYSLDDEAVRSDAAVSVISSIGLTAVIVWADLLGHGFGFAPSSSIIQQLGNARLFFLVGFTLCAIGSVLLARAPQRKTQVLTKAAPLSLEQDYTASPTCKRRYRRRSSRFWDSSAAAPDTTRRLCSYIANSQKRNASSWQ